MKRVVILYATREGQTGRIAEQVAMKLRSRGLDADVKNVREQDAAVDLSSYAGAILAASVHVGRHEREMVRFVKRNLAELEGLPSAFLSVTLSEAGVERRDALPEERAQCAAGVRKVIEDFLRETNWHPKRVKAIAGALRYTQYNPFVGFIMKRIAKKAGGSIDTSRDHEYTDWAALDRFIEEFSDEISSPVTVLPRSQGLSAVSHSRRGCDVG